MLLALVFLIVPVGTFFIFKTASKFSIEYNTEDTVLEEKEESVMDTKLRIWKDDPAFQRWCQRHEVDVERCAWFDVIIIVFILFNCIFFLRTSLFLILVQR